METLIKASAIGWYVAMIVMAMLAFAGALPQALMGFPMGCLAYYAFKEINEWIRL